MAVSYRDTLERPGAIADDDWFASNAPQTSQSFGHPVYDQIADYMRSKGITPTIQDVSQWGTNVDPRYMASIRQAIDRTAPSAPAAPAAAQAPAATAGGDPLSRLRAARAAGDQGAAQAAFNDYFTSKGAQPEDWSYWGPKIMGADGEYYLTEKLPHAEALGNPLPRGAAGTPGNQQFDYPDWTDTFSFDEFKAPTGLTEQNDPCLQDRMQLSLDALQRSAAQKGTLLDTGTLKDLIKFAQDYASNEFQNVYNREANTYLTKYNAAADQYNKRYQQYLQGYQNALNTFNTNFGVDTNLWNRALTEGNVGFQRNLSLADLGLSAINSGANAGANYGANAGSLYTGQGNAAAAGTIAGGNAYGNALSDLANYGSGYLYNRQGNNMQSPMWFGY